MKKEAFRGGDQDVLLPSFTFLSSGGLLLGSGDNNGGCAVNQTTGRGSIGGLEESWRVAKLLFLGVDGRG
jgi:hypothetical protein